ncbi:MAG: hypothetical protein WB783_01325 [Arenicellales bacterium]
MRNISKLFLLISLALFLTACGSKELAAEKTRGSDQMQMKQLDQRALMIQTDR